MSLKLCGNRDDQCIGFNLSMRQLVVTLSMANVKVKPCTLLPHCNSIWAGFGLYKMRFPSDFLREISFDKPIERMKLKGVSFTSFSIFWLF